MPQKHYKNNYLSDVILRIDFPVILDLIENVPNDFQKNIINAFPILEPVKQFELTLHTKGTEFTTQDANKTTWRFKDAKDTISVEIDYQSLTILCKKYTNYTSFKAVIENVIQEFFKIYNQRVINRLGLRYINLITLNEEDLFDWKKYINNNLIASIEYAKDKRLMRRFLQVMELAYDEETMLGFRSGIFNSAYPNKIISKEFTLDYDCYTRGQIENTNLFERIDKYNDIITERFEDSITDNLREKLNGQ